jgi:hypothetical protein
MGLKNQILRRRMKRNSSLATISGLVTASIVTLIGTATGLEPEIILWRAFASGVLMSLLISFGISVIYVANAPS